MLVVGDGVRVGCLLFHMFVVVCCVVWRWPLFVVCHLLCEMGCLLCVHCCVLFVVWLVVSFVALCVVCCYRMTFGVCCLVFGAARCLRLVLFWCLLVVVRCRVRLVLIVC